MRVLMIVSRFIVGGAEVAALELVRALKQRGWEITVAAVRPGGVLRDAFIHAGARVHDGLAHSRFDLTAAVRIARIIRRERIESVILVDVLRNGMLFMALGVILSRRQVGKICWCHSVPGRRSRRFVRPLRWCKAAGLLDAVVCVSQAQRRRIISDGFDAADLPVIPNGVDLSKFRYNGRDARATRSRASRSPRRPSQGRPCHEQADKKVVVQVANVVPEKDFATLLEAAGRLARSRDDFHLVMVGRGTDSPRMVRAVERAGLGGAVTPAGRRRDVPAILAAADIFVLSTKSESFGVAVLEAMAAGLPVVVSDVDAFEDLVTSDVEGLKVPPGDADALSRAIGRLLDEPALRRRLGDAGRRRAELFSVERMADDFHRLLGALR